MIFVTVGTSQFPLLRLLNKVKELQGAGILKGEIVVQKGEAKFSAENMKVFSYLSYLKIKQYLSEADMVITHGGLALTIQAIEYGKNPPIVVPRREEFKEHVDNHQVEFVKFLGKRKQIIAVFDIDKLADAVKNFKQRCRQTKFPSGDHKERLKLVKNLIDYTEKLKNR
jgi:UDP-N-acetylglucosamine transferase subunit ALG13